MLDLAKATAVGVQVELVDGRPAKIWVCIDGQCAVRIQEVDYLNVQIPGHPDFRFGEDDNAHLSEEA